MKNSNRIMLLSGVLGVILTAVSPVVAENAKGAFWQGADTNKDGGIDRAEFDAKHDARFARIDADGNGLLTAEEFKARRDKMHAEMKARHGNGGKMLERMDTSGDGRVTASEWQANSLKRFVRADANGDGAVTAEELAAQPHGKHDRNPDDNARLMRGQSTPGRGGMMDRIDANGDGQVSKAEWEQSGADMFARLDQNGDGRIVAEEFPARHMKHDGDAPEQP